MSDPLPKNQIPTSRVEWAVAILLTIGAIILHIVNALHADGLWRDEASTVLMAKLPSYVEIYKNLQFDSFPILWFVFLRSALHLGFGSDASLRCLGLLVGLSSIAMIWFATLKLTKSPPLISLALIGFSPIFIRWGDSIRGTGLGLVFGLALVPLIWKTIQNFNKKTIFITFIVSLLAIHVNYYNCILLFACIISGVTILSLNHDSKKSVTLLSIGIICALSMTIYIPSMKEAAEWNMILKFNGFDFLWYLESLNKSTGAFGNSINSLMWIALLLIAIILSIFKKTSHKNSNITDNLNILWYLWLCLGVNFISYYIFLKFLGYGTNAWYFILLLGFSAISIDAIISRLSSNLSSEIARVIISCLIPFIIAIFWFPISYFATSERMTSIKSIAQYLEKSANKNDFIILTDSEYAKSFGYYYHGACYWNTIPPLIDGKNALWKNLKDIKQSITKKHPETEIDSVLENINSTLHDNGKVWLVNRIAFPGNGTTPFLISAAPSPSYGWKVAPYKKMWLEILGLDIYKHAKNIHPVIFEKPLPTNGYENPPLFRIEGYRS